MRPLLSLLSCLSASLLAAVLLVFASTNFLLAQRLQTAQTLAANPSTMRLLTGNTGGELISESMAVPLQDVEPFLALSASAVLRGADAQNFTLWIRTSEESSGVNSGATSVQHWSEWIPANADEHGSASGGEQESEEFNTILANRRWTSRLLFLNKETRAVQYKLQFRKTATYRAPSLHSLTLHWCSPGATPEATLEQMKAQAAVNVQADGKVQPDNRGSAKPSQQGSVQALMPRPAFTSRIAWGCPTGETAGANQPNLVSTDVTHLIVHHSFSPGNNITDWPAAVRSVWNFHVNSNGWSDVGYNWLVDPNGVIYQGRAWIGENENTQGAHFCGTNRNTMGVCMLGNYSEIPAPEPALKSLVNILAYRASQRGIDPTVESFHANSGKTIFTISGHRDGVCATECPGNLLYPALPAVRASVAAALKAASATSVQSASVAGFAIESVSPNPLDASAVVRFSIPTSGVVRFVVCNTLGQELRSISLGTANAGTQETTLPTADLPVGAYLLRVEFSNSQAGGQTGSQAGRGGQTSSLVQSLRVVR
jgi:hypothetical protein